MYQLKISRVEENLTYFTYILCKSIHVTFLWQIRVCQLLWQVLSFRPCSGVYRHDTSRTLPITVHEGLYVSIKSTLLFSHIYLSISLIGITSVSALGQALQTLILYKQSVYVCSLSWPISHRNMILGRTDRLHRWLLHKENTVPNWTYYYSLLSRIHHEHVHLEVYTHQR